MPADSAGRYQPQALGLVQLHDRAVSHAPTLASRPGAMTFNPATMDLRPCLRCPVRGQAGSGPKWRQPCELWCITVSAGEPGRRPPTCAAPRGAVASDEGRRQGRHDHPGDLGQEEASFRSRPSPCVRAGQRVPVLATDKATGSSRPTCWPRRRSRVSRVVSTDLVVAGTRKRPRRGTAGDLTTAEVVTVARQDTVEHAALAACTRARSAAPVVDGQRRCGIISRADALCALDRTDAIREGSQRRGEPVRDRDHRLTVKDGIVTLTGSRYLSATRRWSRSSTSKVSWPSGTVSATCRTSRPRRRGSERMDADRQGRHDQRGRGGQARAVTFKEMVAVLRIWPAWSCDAVHLPARRRTWCMRCWPTGRRSRIPPAGPGVSTVSRTCTRRCPRHRHAGSSHERDAGRDRGTRILPGPGCRQ